MEEGGCLGRLQSGAPWQHGVVERLLSSQGRCDDGKGNVEETRPEDENEALTRSHDGCLQVKMDAPVGLQRPSDARPLVGC